MKKIVGLFAVLMITLTLNAQDSIKAEFSVVDVCDGTESAFTNTSKIPSKFGACNYTWRFGDGSVSTDQFPTHTYSLDDNTKHQVFNITLIVQSKAIPTEIDSAHGSTTLFANPNAYFTWDVINKGNTQDVEIDSQATKDATNFYQWTLANVLKSNDITPTFVHSDVQPYLDGSDYTFTLYVRAVEGCEATYSTTFNYNPLGVDDLVEERVIAYPNPSSGEIFFTHTFQEVKVMSLTGEIVFETDSKVNRIGVQLTPGVYMIRAKTDGRQFTQRIVIK